MNPFATLGLEPAFDIDPSELERRYRELQKQLHPDRHVRAPADERRRKLSEAVEVNEAYRALKDDVERASALLRLSGVETAEDGPSDGDPEFLMEMMELREQLGEASMEGDLDAVALLRDRVAGLQSAARREMSRLLGAGAEAAGAEALGEAALLLGRLRYYRRFLDDVEGIEDEAMG